MASVPSITAISAGLAATGQLTNIQTAATAAVVSPLPTSKSVVVDIYDGNTAANQAALVQYLEATHLYRPNTLAGDPNAVIATIDDGSGDLQTAGSEIASAVEANGTHYSELAAWSATAHDNTVISAVQLHAAADYTVSIVTDATGAESATVTNADGTTVSSASGARSLTDGNLHLSLGVNGQFSVAFSKTIDAASTATIAASVGYGDDAVAAVTPAAAKSSAGSAPPAAATIESSTTTISNAVPFVPTKTTPLISSKNETHATAGSSHDAGGGLQLSFFLNNYEEKTYATPWGGQSGNAVTTLSEATISYGKQLAVAPQTNINISA